MPRNSSGAAIYLVSPGASFTAGHTLVVDGGFLTRGVGFPGAGPSKTTK